ncbi:hypothetical protein D3C76_671730 [compost metagenome]
MKLRPRRDRHASGWRFLPLERPHNREQAPMRFERMNFTKRFAIDAEMPRCRDAETLRSEGTATCLAFLDWAL